MRRIGGVMLLVIVFGSPVFAKESEWQQADDQGTSQQMLAADTQISGQTATSASEKPGKTAAASTRGKARWKHHTATPETSTASGEQAVPPGLAKQGKQPAGLEKKGHVPPGWARGKADWKHVDQTAATSHGSASGADTAHSHHEGHASHGHGHH